jgi:adenylate cyclase
MVELPQFASIYLGFQNSDFYAINRASERSAASLAKIGAPPETVYVERIILRAEQGFPVERSHFLDDQGQVLGSVTSQTVEYDPRKRPWYRAAIARSGLIRTDPYIFESSRKPGLTVAKQQGSVVVGADVTLAELERFLATTAQAKNGLLAIVHGDGEILAKSTGLDEPAAEPSADEDAGMPTLNALIEGLRTDVGFVSGTIELDDRDWVVRTANIELGGGEQEKLVIAMPIDMITAPINRASQRNVIVSLLIFAASIPVIWLIARSMSRPLTRIVLETELIRRFQLDDPVSHHSIVAEIEQLDGAVSRMRSSLRTFALYVPKTLVQRLIAMNEPPTVGGRRRDLTIFFMDLENFTAMSSTLPPEEVMTRMSRYFEVVTDCLRDHEATIDKYIGDAVMAFWNAPDTVEDHTAKACRAALAIARVAKRETDGWTTDGPPIRTRIGIHAGEAIVGNVGSSDRLNYTALGSTVNLAARLEALNRELGTTILVSQEVTSRVGDRFVFHHAGKTAPKGFSEPVDFFELIGEAADASTSPPPANKT